jgi:hypothetical protein
MSLLEDLVIQCESPKPRRTIDIPLYATMVGYLSGEK